MAQLEGTPPKSVLGRPSLDPQIVEVGQEVLRAFAAQVTTESEASQSRHDLEVNEGRGVQITISQASPKCS